MHPVSVPTCSPGAIEDQILSVKAQIIGGGTLLLLIEPGYYRQKYYGLWVNGVNIPPNIWIPATGVVEVSVPIPPGTDIGSINFQDAGDYPVYPDDFIPDIYIEEWEALTSQTLRFQWQSTYTVSTVRGDSQLSSISILAASRKTNVETDPVFPQRGLLNYSIEDISGTRIVRWYANERLVAEGSRVGDGALECIESNGSGLTITCTITYADDLAMKIAYVELQWPKHYEIHFSQGTLTFPRAYEALVKDHGGDIYLFLSTKLDYVGITNWNCQVVPVDDEGNKYTAATPIVLQIRNPPLAPTITSVSGGSTVTVNFTNGEAGCTYNVYSSPRAGTCPINFGNYETPEIVNTALNATSANLTGYDPTLVSVDRTSDWNDLKAAFDTFVTNMDSNYTQASFSGVLSTNQEALLDSLSEFGDLINERVVLFKEELARKFLLLESFDESFVGYDEDDWLVAMGDPYGGFLAFLGDVLEGKPNKYTLPNGALPGGASPTDETGTGSSLLFTGSINSVRETLFQLATNGTGNLVRPIQYRAVVRAEKGGVEEQNNDEWVWEFNGTEVQGKRPNPATIRTVDFNSGTILVNAFILQDNAETNADYIDLYCVPFASSINLSSPQASSSLLRGPVMGIQSATINYAIPAEGHYRLAVVGRKVGVRSAYFKETVRFLGITTNPANIINLEGKVIRGRGINKG